MEADTSPFRPAWKDQWLSAQSSPKQRKLMKDDLMFACGQHGTILAGSLWSNAFDLGFNRTVICETECTANSCEQCSHGGEYQLKGRTGRRKLYLASIYSQTAKLWINGKGSTSLRHRESRRHKPTEYWISQRGLEQGARELNYLLPLEWADVIIIIYPGLRWRAAGAGRISADMWV